MYVISITPSALADVKNGIEYYNSQKGGLGAKFLSSIKSLFKKIKEMPLSASIAYDDIRYKVDHKFPYIVLYEIDGKHIHILRVFNTHRKPIY